MNIVEHKRKKVIRKEGITLEFILDFYDAWLRESEYTKVAAALNTTFGSLRDWTEQSPELQLAKRLADQRRGDRSSLSGYVYKQLSSEAKEVWDRIQFWEDRDQSSYEKIQEILSGKSKRIKQELFIHALVCSNFNLSNACRLVSLSRATLETWRREDLEFCQLVEEIQWHKKNFFEHALIDLVEQRYPGAVLFVNRTVNADRGYTERIAVEHTGSIDTSGFSLDDLDLDLDTRRKILEAIKRKENTKTVTDVPSTMKMIEA